MPYPPSVVRTVPRRRSALVLIGLLCLTLALGTAQAQDLHWTAADGPYGGAIRAVVFDGDTVVAATSEHGVFSTDDGGTSWTRLGLGGRKLRALVQGPSGTLYAGAYDGGVYRRMPGSTAWATAGTGLRTHRVQALAIAENGTLYAGTFNDGVFRLRADDTWEAVNDALIDLDVRALAFGAGGTLYAATFNTGVFRLDQGTSTWRPVGLATGPRTMRSVLVDARGTLYAAGWSGGIYKASEDRASWQRMMDGLPTERVWTLAHTDQGGLFAGLHGGGVYRYDAAAQRWTFAGLPEQSVRTLAVDGANRLWGGSRSGLYRADAPGAWSLVGVPVSYVYAIEPVGDDVIAGTFLGGLFRSSDGGHTWRQTGLNDWDLYDLVVTSAGSILAGGFFGIIFRSTDGGHTWQEANQDDADDRTIQNVWSLGVAPEGTVFAGTLGDGAFRSTDDGLTWTRTGLDEHTVNAFTFADGVLAATSNGAFRSTDGGATWKRMAAFAEMPVLTWHRTATGQLWAGTDGEGIFRSDDQGATWTATGLRFVSVTGLTSTPDGMVYASTFGSGVYRLPPSGDGWERVSRNLDNPAVWTLALDNGHLLAGTHGTGVFRTEQDLVTAVESPLPVAHAFVLHANYPNPFRDATTITWTMQRSGAVRLTVYDVVGAKVATLIEDDVPAGEHTVRWAPRGLPSGVYFYRLQANGTTMTRRMTVVR